MQYLENHSSLIVLEPPFSFSAVFLIQWNRTLWKICYVEKNPKKHLLLFARFKSEPKQNHSKMTKKKNQPHQPRSPREDRDAQWAFRQWWRTAQGWGWSRSGCCPWTWPEVRHGQWSGKPGRLLRIPCSAVALMASQCLAKISVYI